MDSTYKQRLLQRISLIINPKKQIHYYISKIEIINQIYIYCYFIINEIISLFFKKMKKKLKKIIKKFFIFLFDFRENDSYSLKILKIFLITLSILSLGTFTIFRLINND